MEKLQINPFSADELERVLNLWEWDFCDFKSARIKGSDLQDDIVAFANSQWWDIYVWIGDKRRWYPIEGFGTIEDTESIIDSIYRDIKPSIDGISHQFLGAGGQIIVKITIPQSRNIHETSKGDVYERRGSKKIRLDHEMILKLKYKKGIASFEDSPKDIDQSLLIQSDYLKDLLLRLKSTHSATEYLQKNNFLYSGKPKVSAVVCFSDLPQAITRCAVKIIRLNFQKTARQYAYKRERTSDSDHTIEGPIELLLLRALWKIDDILHEISAKYPKEAIRETLVNAVIHRDFSIPNDVHVRIYDNCIEITSPWGFSWGITKSNILNAERFLRNPQITRALFQASALQPLKDDRLNQDQGEWIRTIFDSMRRAKLSDPSFDEENNSVTVTLWHIPAESYEQKILKYLGSHETITNKEARQLTWEEDKERIKIIFNRLVNKGEIEINDPSAPKSKRSYRLKWNSNSTEEMNLSLF